jgi:hypothetical protein
VLTPEQEAAERADISLTIRRHLAAMGREL